MNPHPAYSMGRNIIKAMTNRDRLDNIPLSCNDEEGQFLLRMKRESSRLYSDISLRGSAITPNQKIVGLRCRWFGWVSGYDLRFTSITETGEAILTSWLANQEKNGNASVIEFRKEHYPTDDEIAERDRQREVLAAKQDADHRRHNLNMLYRDKIIRLSDMVKQHEARMLEISYSLAGGVNDVDSCLDQLREIKKQIDINNTMISDLKQKKEMVSEIPDYQVPSHMELHEMTIGNRELPM